MAEYKFKIIKSPYTIPTFLEADISLKDTLIGYLNKIKKKDEEDKKERENYFYLKDGGLVIIKSFDSLLGILAYCKKNTLNKLEKLTKQNE